MDVGEPVGDPSGIDIESVRVPYVVDPDNLGLHSAGKIFASEVVG
jgi:hypothetical protein